MDLARPASPAIGLILFLLGVWAVRASWFSMTVTDYPPESGLVSETTSELTEDSDARHEPLLDVELVEQLRVQPIELAASPLSASQSRTFAAALSPVSRLPLLAAEADSHVYGSQAWVTILCRFADAADVTPPPVSYYEDMMGASHPGLDHYWREVSYGDIDLGGSVVVGWYDLPQPHSYYLYTNEAGEEDYDLQKTAEDCTAAADTDVFFPDFDGINFIFLDMGGPARGGSLWLTNDGQTHSYGFTWLPHKRQMLISLIQQYVWTHEMGHAFGLPHSSGPYDETYDSDWDVMSGGHSLDPLLPYGSLGVHPITYHKDLLGWIPADRRYVAASNTTRTITLERLAQPGPEGYLMAQIPIGGSPTGFYTVEARLFAGYDKGIPGEAVVLHKIDTARGKPAQVVDVDNNGDPNDEGAMWTPGEIFTDSKNGIQVSIEAATATSYRVTINTNPATFATCIDFLSPTNSRHIFGPGRDNARIQVEAASNCHWAATSDIEWIRITSGGRGSGPGSVSYIVAANTTGAARTGTLTIDGWTFTVIQAGVNDSLFEDDMESGTEGWFVTTCGPDDCPDSPLWAVTTLASRSGTHAWTDSPGGNYQNDRKAALLSPIIDLTEVDSAFLTFWHQYDFGSGDVGMVWIARQMLGGKWEIDEPLRVFTGPSPSWEQVVIDLTPFVGEPRRLAFHLASDVTQTADGWYIDDIAIFPSGVMTPGPPQRPQALLENPSMGSAQSGVGVISGWACEAEEIVIELDGMPLKAGYGTTREDTRSVCGDADNGFSLLWNWNNLGAGTHTVRALIDGVEFANTTVRVTTFGEDPFPRGWSGTFDLPNFPTSGETAVVRWEESLQNFVITDGSLAGGGGYNRVAGIDAILENPSLGAAQSGVSAISGWACHAQEIVIELNGVPYRAGYGTTRPDTQGVCGDTDNGFSLLWNWNNLGPGTHTVRAMIDGVEFADTTVRVTTFGEPFLRGVGGTFPIPDFPSPGENKKIRWEQSLQNFVIIP